jgi:hypothetical protein
MAPNIVVDPGHTNKDIARSPDGQGIVWVRDSMAVIYLCSERGIVTVVKCGDTFAVTHQADLHASIAATPALDQHSLYLRTDEALLAFR